MKSKSPQNDKAPITYADVAKGMDRICRDIGSLQGEVNQLTNLLGQFIKGQQLSRFDWTAEIEIDRQKGERSSTPEPRSRIRDALHLLQNANTIEELTLMLKAVSRDLDGAMTDIRAARLQIEFINGNSDARDEFLNWRNRNA